ncbi:MAG: anthranilate synthase component I [Candidatus Omnitrophota bacterium]|jgi:anthranilate synthase component 1
MYYPSLNEFIKLTKKGNVIPVYRELNADMETPVSAFLKIEKNNDYTFLLESVEGQENLARYSFLGVNPSLIFKSKGRSIEIIHPEKNTSRKFLTNSSPLDEVKNIMFRFKSVPLPSLPRFYGGLVGFIGYDMVRFFECLPDKNPDELNTPDAVLMLMDTLLIFDHVKHTIKIVSNVILPEKANISVREKTKYFKNALLKIDKAFFLLNQPIPEGRGLIKGLNLKPCSNYTKAQFEKIVRDAKAHIKKGDIIQVVPSQRFKLKTNKDAFTIYRTLRSLNPSPYMFLLKFKEFNLVGASPEMLVRCEDGIVQTRPIAGTRPRGKDSAEDIRFAAQLIKDKKERAEHLMLVDLGRNDLGRISKVGSVKVSEFMNVEKYSHVMHLVSEVKGRLDNNRYDIYDVIKAAFPAGTVSGSPKIRAMEIIDELENTRRGPYAGCVGYFSFSHNMDTCITIRTILIKGNTAYVQAGAGIVADSHPGKEYTETVNKAMALIEAIKQ